MRADLHVHSTASDGTLTPAELIDLARERSVRVLAIADHDTVAGIDSALHAAEAANILLIPAVELSAVYEGHDVHILGYFIDHRSEALLRELDILKTARHERASAMVAALRAAGYDIHMDDVLRTAGDGAVGRSHIARTMVELGHVDSIRAAFVDYIGHGRPFYISKATRTPAEAVELIHSAGGVAIVAHPGVSRIAGYLDALIDCGLDGIEAYHADHSPEDVEKFARMAAERGLLVSGGTDYHGPQAANPDLGTAEVPAAAVEALLQLGSSSH